MVQTNLQGGAKGAHAWSGVPGAWRPEAAKRDRGATEAPQDILEEQADSWRKLRGATTQAAPRGRRHSAKGGRSYSPAELREAAEAFPKRTAGSADVLHVKHYGLLSDGGLAAIGTLLEVVDLLGAWPKALQTMVIALLDKEDKLDSPAETDANDKMLPTHWHLQRAVPPLR